jgi:hypothetical protein
MSTYLLPLRRTAEAVAARLNYDYLCYKGPLMDEDYLIHSVSDVLCSFYDPTKVEIKKKYRHPGLSEHAKQLGRKPEVDYIAIQRDSSKVELAMEAKWAGSSHCTAENILWDLVRLKLIKETHPEAICGLLIAGHKGKTENLFKHKFFAPGSEHPLILDKNRQKKFSLVKNRDHQSLIDKEMKKWIEGYPSAKFPESLTTQLEECSASAHPSSRFVARCWKVL